MQSHTALKPNIDALKLQLIKGILSPQIPEKHREQFENAQTCGAIWYMLFQHQRFDLLQSLNKQGVNFTANELDEVQPHYELPSWFPMVNSTEGYYLFTKALAQN